MAKLNSIIFADDAKPSQDGHVNLIGIFDTIFTYGFPSIHPRFVVFVNFDVEHGDINEYFTISSEGVQVIKGSTSLIGNVPKQQYIHNVQNAYFEKPGKYIVEIFVNDKKIGENYFLVNQVQQNGGRK
jgi:hypothetical protein